LNEKKWMVWVAMAGICVLPGWAGDARAQGTAPTRRAAAPPSVPRQVEARQRQWLQAIVARDAAAAGLLLAEDLTVVNFDGTILTRAGVLDRMKENRLTLDAIETKEVTVKPYGTAALWQGKVTFVRQGTPLAEARVTALWVRRAGSWRLANLTSVPLASSGQSVATNFLLGSREMITDSGLKYEDLVEGTGESPRPGQMVVVHYTGTLENGKKFDSSLDRGRPFEFAIGQGRVIKGWDEGVMSMKVGGKRRLIIPPALGYGNRDLGVIPPNSTLIFEVELLELK